MDIKATQLKNTQTATVDTTATRTPAKTTETGATFVDELSSMTNLGVENKVETLAQTPDITKSAENTSKKETSSETFEFISTSEKFSDKLKKDNLTQNEKQVLRQNAEKELVDEIVLMNKKDVKNSKTELKTAQASVSQKSDKQIEAEKQDSKQIQDLNNEAIVLLPQENQKNENKVVSQAPQEFEQTDKIDLSENKNDLKVVGKNNTLDDIVTNDTKDVEMKQTAKNDVNFGKIDNKNEINFDKVDNKNHVNVDKIDNTKFSKNENKVQNNNENKVLSNKNEKIQPNIDEISQNEVKVLDKVANNKVEEVFDTKDFSKDFSKNLANDLTNNVSKVGKNDEHSLLNKLDKTNKNENGKNVTNIKNKPILSEEIDDVQKIDNLKNITKDIDVKAIADKPIATEEMTVIKFEPISPVIELDKTLNSSKTSDIVKFLDANLTTNNTNKTSKASSTKSAEKSAEKTIKMTEADAKFFNNLIDSNQQIIDGTKTAEASNTTLRDVEEAQSVQVSKSLLNALKESQENNKSFRVDFDKDLSVILRVNKDGKISAEFLPGDKAVEQYLKANIPLLQQQFKDEGLEYENLSYRQSKKDDEDKQKQNNRNNKKENGYE